MAEIPAGANRPGGIPPSLRSTEEGKRLQREIDDKARIQAAKKASAEHAAKVKAISEAEAAAKAKAEAEAQVIADEKSAEARHKGKGK